MDDINDNGTTVSATLADDPNKHLSPVVAPARSSGPGRRGQPEADTVVPAADAEVTAIMTTTSALEQLRGGSRTRAASTVLEVMGQLEQLPGPARQTVREVIATLDALVPAARERVLAFLGMRYGGSS